MSSNSPTCNYVYVNHYEFLCCNDYSACYGQDRCRYPEILKAMGIGRETESSVIIPENPSVISKFDASSANPSVAQQVKVSRKHVFNPALRAENKVHSDHPIFYWWSSMCHACYNYRSKSYAYTGGKGIRVHPDWHKAEIFIAGFSSYNKMTDKMQRLDRNLDFDPDNYVIIRGDTRIYYEK